MESPAGACFLGLTLCILESRFGVSGLLGLPTEMLRDVVTCLLALCLCALGYYGTRCVDADKMMSKKDEEQQDHLPKSSDAEVDCGQFDLPKSHSEVDFGQFDCEKDLATPPASPLRRRSWEFDGEEGLRNHSDTEEEEVGCPRRARTRSVDEFAFDNFGQEEEEEEDFVLPSNHADAGLTSSPDPVEAQEDFLLPKRHGEVDFGQFDREEDLPEPPECPLRRRSWEENDVTDFAPGTMLGIPPEDYC